MRILLISTSVVPIGYNGYGGVETMLLTWAKTLLKARQEVIIAAPQGSRVPEGIKLIETVKLPEEQDRDDLAVNSIYASAEMVYDVIHDFSHGHVLGRSMRLPLVSMMWDNITFRYNKAKYNVVCLSNWQRERFEQGYNQRAIVMPPFFDIDSFDPAQKRGERFLFLGKLTAEKGADSAIRYAKELGVSLDVAGGLIPSDSRAYLDDLKASADGHQITVRFDVTEEEKRRLLSTAKALIYPVRQEEAHCAVLVEAFASGCPVIVNDRGAMREVMYEKRFVVDSEEEFKRAMARIDEYDRDAVLTAVRQDYSSAGTLPKWLDLYEKVAMGAGWA